MRAAVPGVEAFAADNTRTGYLGLTLTALTGIDAGIKNVKVSYATATGYCIFNTKPVGVPFHKAGPAGDIAVNGC